MSATRERWMLFATFILTVLFACFFIWPNYRGAEQASHEAGELEVRIQQLERRQAEVEAMRLDFQSLQRQVQLECKHVPTKPDMAQIVQALSLEVDGMGVLDQSFTAGTASTISQQAGFSMQPLAVTLHADFSSIFSVIKRVESMDRLVHVSSVQMSRSESDSDAQVSVLEAAIGLHAIYDTQEGP